MVNLFSYHNNLTLCVWVDVFLNVLLITQKLLIWLQRKKIMYFDPKDDTDNYNKGFI